MRPIAAASTWIRGSTRVWSRNFESWKDFAAASLVGTAAQAGSVEEEVTGAGVAGGGFARHQGEEGAPAAPVQAAARAASGFGPVQIMSALRVKRGPGPSSGRARFRPPPAIITEQTRCQ